MQLVYSITSYGKRPNEYDSVSNYFKSHFIQVHRSKNPGQRVLYIHMTSVVVCLCSSFSLEIRFLIVNLFGLSQDTKTTQAVIINVRDSIFRGYLKDAALV